jgi:CheY-like chemotaxis protein
MAAGGVINIRARNVPASRSAGSVDMVELTVADTGVGMTREVAARVFEPFFTTKEVGKGSGLGLAQVYAFVTSAGGQVSIDSKPGEGTAVTLKFIHADRISTAKAEPSRFSPRAEGLRRGRVLLVEDDQEVAALIGEMLDSIGFEAQHVPSADAALAALESGTKFDFVLSDVRMPGGMNGVELAHEIRRRDLNLQVVLSTAYPASARNAQAQGISVLIKPYSIEALSKVFVRRL